MYCDSKKHFCYNIYTYIVFVNTYTKTVLEEYIYIYVYVDIKKLYVRHTDKKMFIKNFVYVCFCTNI